MLNALEGAIVALVVDGQFGVEIDRPVGPEFEFAEPSWPTPRVLCGRLQSSTVTVTPRFGREVRRP